MWVCLLWFYMGSDYTVEVFVGTLREHYEEFPEEYNNEDNYDFPLNWSGMFSSSLHGPDEDCLIIRVSSDDDSFIDLRAPLLLDNIRGFLEDVENFEIGVNNLLSHKYKFMTANSGDCVICGGDAKGEDCLGINRVCNMFTTAPVNEQPGELVWFHYDSCIDEFVSLIKGALSDEDVFRGLL